MSESAAKNITTIASRFQLKRFDELQVGTESPYLVKGFIPRFGITVAWGPPKCGKSFWVSDLALHVALGWEYRGRKVRQGPVVYFAFEGAEGFQARAEAFRQARLPEDHGSIDFYLVGAQANLIADHEEMVGAIRSHGVKPVLVVLDTLNRSLVGSESSDEDMAAYVAAAEFIRTELECAIIIVHHCGVDATRPRGHTSLTGAVHAQLAVKRDAAESIVTTVEWMKDGPEGASILSRLEVVEVGHDVDGDPITSCVVAAVEAPTAAPVAAEPRLSKNQKTLFSILHDAGHTGLTLEDWNSKARSVGIGVSRKADLYDLRNNLVGKRLVREADGRWFVNHNS